jgi:glycosyltransferase involved in cell wall biosynthesis
LLAPRDSAPKNKAAIATLAADAALRRRMGEAGRQRVIGKFGEAMVAQQTVALLRSMINEGGGAE